MEIKTYLQHLLRKILLADTNNSVEIKTISKYLD